MQDYILPEIISSNFDENHPSFDSSASAYLKMITTYGVLDIKIHQETCRVGRVHLLFCRKQSRCDIKHGNKRGQNLWLGVLPSCESNLLNVQIFKIRLLIYNFFIKLVGQSNVWSFEKHGHKLRAGPVFSVGAIGGCLQRHLLEGCRQSFNCLCVFGVLNWVELHSLATCVLTCWWRQSTICLDY